MSEHFKSSEIGRLLLSEIPRGFQISIEQGRKHRSITLLSPDGRKGKVFISVSPSDVNALANIKRDLRRKVHELTT
jgi:hypothetical protein